MDDKRYIFENIFWKETTGVVSETMDQKKHKIVQ